MFDISHYISILDVTKNAPQYISSKIIKSTMLMILSKMKSVKFLFCLLIFFSVSEPPSKTAVPKHAENRCSHYLLNQKIEIRVNIEEFLFDDM